MVSLQLLFTTALYFMLLLYMNAAHAVSSPQHTVLLAENKSQLLGIQRLVLLTTRTADWFQQRGFEPAGVAHDSLLLPDSRRLKVGHHDSYAPIGEHVGSCRKLVKVDGTDLK
jgi:hypothetical protein